MKSHIVSVEFGHRKKKYFFSILSILILLFWVTGCQRVGKAIDRRINDPANARPARVSLNKRGIANQGSAQFRFFVIGHGYGSPNTDDHIPDLALLEKIPELQAMDLAMLVSLGDIVQHSIAEDFDNLERRLLSQVSFPVINIPGNHDVEDRAAYEARYGKTFFSFRIGSTQMVFLDTERENCAIDSEQQAMLSKVIAAALKDQKTQNIFIFMHKTLFFKNDQLVGLNKGKGLPNVMECYGSESFPPILQKTILPAAQEKPVYLFAGDVGAWGNLSPYYEKSADAMLTMVMTGLGDTSNDAGILVTVDGSDVQLEAYSLTGKAMQPLESYTPEYWIDQVK